MSRQQKTASKVALETPPAFEELTQESYDKLIRDLHKKVYEAQYKADFFQMKLYGQSSERLAAIFDESLTPLLPGLECLQSQGDEKESSNENQQKTTQDSNSKQQKKKQKKNCGFPDHLPREDVHLYPEGYDAETVAEDPDLVELAPEISEQLANIPQVLYIKRIIRHKIAKRSRPDDGVAIAKPLPKVIDKGRFDVSFIATILVSKYCYHLPLHRLEVWFKRQGIPLPRSTLCRQVMHASKLLQPLYDLLCERVLKGNKLYSDDTTVKLRVSLNRKTKQSRIWLHAGDAKNPYAVYKFSTTREHRHAIDFLKDFKGTIQCDAYQAYITLSEKDSIELSLCWAHARRYFADALKLGEKGVEPMLKLMAQLFKIEREANEEGLTAVKRKIYRDEHAPKILKEIETWRDTNINNIRLTGKAREGLRYLKNNWQGLQKYLDDGDLEITNNYAERLLRIVAIGRKNWTFFATESGGEAAATIYSICQSCVLNDVDPWLYLVDVMPRLTAGYQDNEEALTSLLPDRWKQTHEAQAKASQPDLAKFIAAQTQ